MAEVTYYFNARGDIVWADPDNIVDNNLETFGSTATNGAAQVLTGNDCPGTDLGTITKVELRLYGKGDGDDHIDITPIFSAGDGDPHRTTPVVSPGDWTAYIDITNDTNHPDWSLWSHIQTLDCKIAFAKQAKANTVYCAKVEIRVTYTPYVAPTVTTQAVSDIETTTATGNGTIVDTGGQNCSKRGVCWNTTGNPTVADSKSEETDSFGTDAFSRPMTGLTPGEHYYVKAYAYNSAGYGYGSEVEFDTFEIDVGSAPIDRVSAYAAGYTLIDKGNPANASGVLHTVKVYAFQNITGLRVGTFYTTNGNTLKCRDSELIGDVTAGAERTFTELSITVVTGDYIGCYYTGGAIDLDTASFTGIWGVEGEYIDPNDEVEYTSYIGYAISLYGYGDIIPTPPSVTTETVDDIGLTTATGNGTITETFENCSKRGVCWNTTGNPTVADDKSEETDSFGIGAFSRPMTGLTASTHYYVRAYAYNSEGYGYGNEVEFDTAWEPPVSDIDVGADPIDRIDRLFSVWTCINKSNPANASGTLHSVKVYAKTDVGGLIVGTFYITNGNTLKCRDSELIGDVESGAERTFTGLSIAVEEGDYIGCYFATGSIERDTTGFAGVWNKAGEYIDPADETTYFFYAGDAISLYGYGDIVAAPENTVYLVKATGKRTQLSAGAVAIRIDPATGRRSLDTSLTKFLVREDDGTLRAKSA